MPDLSSNIQKRYSGLDPYHVHFDNLPIDQIRQILEAINDQVEIDSTDLQLAKGTASTLHERLDVSLNGDGTLKSSVAEDFEHSIASHTDGTSTVSGSDLTAYQALGFPSLTNPVSFVRMLDIERDKLALISEEATSLKIEFQGEAISASTIFADQQVIIEDSDTVTWSIASPNKVMAHMSFPIEAAHQHVYDAVPVHGNISSPNYINYKVTSLATPFVTGSLRVHINGIRLNQSTSVYVPGASGPDSTWTLTKFTENAGSGTFALNRAISASDVIRIDFDIALG